MDSKQELMKLQAEFAACQKVLTALGDETRQHLFSHVEALIQYDVSERNQLDNDGKKICEN